MQMLRPNVRLDPGFTPDDEFALRIVDKMLEALTFDLKEIMNLQDSNLFRRHHKRIGHPEGQKAYYEALLKQMDRAVLACGIITGKRKKFSIDLDFWSPMATVSNEKATRLGGVRLTLIGRGPGIPMKPQVDILSALTRHAMVRLVQRANCRTPEDLLHVLQETWRWIQLAVVCANWTNSELPSGNAPGWLIPARGVNGGSNFFLVLKAGDMDIDGPIYSIVPTVLEETMLVDIEEAFTPYLNFLKKIEGDIEKVNDNGLRLEFIDALKKTAIATGRRPS